MENKFLVYRGRPLVRCKDQIFYGDPSKSQIILIHVDSESTSSPSVPDKLSIGLFNSLAAFKGHIFKPLKYSVKNSLFESLDLASAWLDRVESSQRVN